MLFRSTRHYRDALDVLKRIQDCTKSLMELEAGDAGAEELEDDPVVGVVGAHPDVVDQGDVIQHQEVRVGMQDFFDALPGLPNRRQLDQAYHGEWERARRNRLPREALKAAEAFPRQALHAALLVAASRAAHQRRHRRVAEAGHDREGTHVDDQVLVAEGRAAVGLPDLGGADCRGDGGSVLRSC